VRTPRTRSKKKRKGIFVPDIRNMENDSKVLNGWRNLPSDFRMYMIEHFLSLHDILNLRAMCTLMRSERDVAYATGNFSSCVFDKYIYHSVKEVEGIMATGIRLRSFHFELEGLPNGMNALHRMC